MEMEESPADQKSECTQPAEKSFVIVGHDDDFQTRQHNKDLLLSQHNTSQQRFSNPPTQQTKM